MAKTKQQKQEVVDALSDKMKGAKSAIIFKHEGLPVAATEELRVKCKEQNIEVFAVKKTLLQLALEAQDIKDADVKSFDGGIAIAICPEDEVAAAKIINDFAKTNEQLEFRAGVLEGKLIPLDMVKKLAELPSKQELLAQVVGSMKSPISGFVHVMKGNLSGLINVLSAIKDNK
jgi:large subunit ribosomal protein L10